MSTKLTEYQGDTGLVEDWLNGIDITSDYDDIFDVTFEVQYTVGEWRFEGYDTSCRFTHKNISGREIRRVCSLTDYELTDWLNSHTSFRVNSGDLAHSIRVIDRTLVKSNEKQKPGSSGSSSSSSRGEEVASVIGGLIMLIISVCVFLFYAKEEFGMLWGIPYSIFWYVTIPIHYFFF